MDKESARKLVKETFTQAFDETRYKDFVRDLVHRYDDAKAFVCSHAYIKDAFKDHVNYFKRLGTFTSPASEKLDILVVHLASESKLERARTALRNFVAGHLKDRDEKDAALVAFVSPTEKAWRFSYVKMEYVPEEKASGKIGVTQELTPAKRSSYLVGEGESCHTAQSRFLNLLQNTVAEPALADIEAAFSVETVTKEFFASYASLFDRLNLALEKIVMENKPIAAEFKARNVNTVDFAKKLLGQIVFLYFLQKKGWLGVPKGGTWGNGPHNFMRQAIDRKFGAYDNFFNDILEPLFYSTLATQRGADSWCPRFNSRIPFLNGGLFEPMNGYNWHNVDLLVPNELFTNKERTAAGDEGTGILDVFDRFNFTVNEAEPLEKEVAIDPEMLGMVFENLIEENRRRVLGARYTPREIVHYMCQEALINYLDVAVNMRREGLAAQAPTQGVLFGQPPSTQGILEASYYYEVIPRSEIEEFIRMGDHAALYESARMSGTKSYTPKMPQSIQNNAELLDAKLKEITVCDPAVGSGAFPVGMMNEIVRARAALTPYFGDKDLRTPYHFKRHAVQHSLYGVDLDAGAVEIAKLRLWLSLVVDEEDVTHIRPLPNLDYKIVAGNSLFGVEATLFNEEALRKLEALKLQVFNVSDHSKKYELKRRIDDLLDEVTHGKKVFDFWVYFSEVFSRRGGFDVTIGNPPYVRQEEFKELKPALKNEYTCFTGVADLLVYFFERSWQLLRPDGTHAFITSNKWLRAGYGEKLRGFLARSTRILNIIDFGDAAVFEAIAYPCILIFQKTTAYGDSQLARAFTWEPGPPLEKFASVFAANAFDLPQRELKPDAWRLESATVLRLLDKLRRAGKPLGEYVNGRMYRGIVTGLNEAFVVDRATRDRLIATHASSKDVLKPYLRGRDVKRWQAEPQDLWLLFVPWHFPLHADTSITGASKKAEVAFERQYPAVYAHLSSFKKELSARNEDETGVRYEWYALQRMASEYWEEFEKPKIVIPAITGTVNYAVDREKHYSNNKTTIVVTNEIEYLLGLLNSKLAMWLVRQTHATKQGGFFDFEPRYSSRFPVVNATPPQQNEIEQFVEKILAAKKNDTAADVSAWEREIDDRVYRLYGLNREEIGIIEGGK